MGMRLSIGLVGLLIASVGSSQAAVINSADVNIGGTDYSTFLDQSTGLTWLDLDNVWTPTSTYNSITTLLSGSGFHLASSAEVTTLQASIPAVPANYLAEALIIGANYFGHPHPGDDREIMWAIYEDGNSADGVSFSYRNGYDVSWSDGLNFQTAGDPLPDSNAANLDLGAWVVSDAPLSSVPEPSTGLLLALGAISLMTARARNRKSTPRQ